MRVCKGILALLLLIAALATGCKSAAPSADYDIQDNITQIIRDGLPKRI